MFEFDKPRSMAQDKYEYLQEWFRVRYLVLLRDKCACQAGGCDYKERISQVQEVNPETGWFKESKLQIHHLTHREEFKLDPELHEKLGHDMDDSENLTTLCEPCHVRYHNGTQKLVVDGRTYQIGDNPRRTVDFIKLRHKRKEIIKANKHHVKPLTWDMLAILLKWLADEWERQDK